MKTDNLTNEDHHDWDRLVYHLLDQHVAGKISNTEIVTELGHLLGAVDIGNLGEFRAGVRVSRGRSG